MVGAHLGGPAERREVVRPDQRVTAQAHPFQIEGRLHVPGVAAGEGVGDRTVVHRVAVAARHRREAGMEVRLGHDGLADHDGAAAQLGHRPAQVDHVEPVAGASKVIDLAPGVHPGIGAPGTGQLDRAGPGLARGLRSGSRPPWSRPGWRRSPGSRCRRRPPSCAPGPDPGRRHPRAPDPSRARRCPRVGRRPPGAGRTGSSVNAGTDRRRGVRPARCGPWGRCPRGAVPA